MSTNLGRANTDRLTNKSGAAVAYGDVVIMNMTTAASFDTTTTAAYVAGVCGICVEPNGIANDATGLIAFAGAVAQINLNASASLGDFVGTHTVAKQGTPHATLQTGDFAQVKGTGATPAAWLFGYGVITAGAAVYYAPSGLTGATEASRYVGATASGAPASGTFAVGDFVIAQNGNIYICTVAGAPGTWSLPASTSRDYILMHDQKTANTQGGTFTQGAWRVRDINTEVFDVGGHASVTANQITLAAGTYECRIEAPAYRVAGHRAKLRNVTDAADVTGLHSNSGFSGDSTNNAVDMATINGRFAIAASKTFEIWHYCNNTTSTNGFGLAANIDSLPEIYTVAEFWKVA